MSEQAPCGVPISLCKRLELIDHGALQTWAVLAKEKAVRRLCAPVVDEMETNRLRGQIMAFDQVLGLQSLVQKSLETS